MTNRTKGRAAVVLALGFLIVLADPSHAADPATTGTVDMTAPGNPADAQAQVAPDNSQAAQPDGTDQPGDTDRAARPDDVRAPVIVTQQAQTDTPAPHASPVVSGSQSATWDETSLIGKIFIGFGALLTIASAARMFMA